MEQPVCPRLTHGVDCSFQIGGIGGLKESALTDPPSVQSLQR